MINKIILKSNDIIEFAEFKEFHSTDKENKHFVNSFCGVTQIELSFFDIKVTLKEKHGALSVIQVIPI